MRVMLVIVLLVATIVLAIELGMRMSTEALGVVLGVACGVAAGIPMSVLILAALRRRTGAELDRGGAANLRQQQPQSYPPVVVIQGGTPLAGNPAPPYYPAPMETAPRHFRIVGEDEP